MRFMMLMYPGMQEDEWAPSPEHVAAMPVQRRVAQGLAKLGRGEEAEAEFRRAASLAANERERELLLKRAAECGPPG